MTDKQTLLPDEFLWPSRLLFVAAIIFISQQMLTNVPVTALASVWDKLSHFSAWALLVTLGYCSCRSQRRFPIIAIAVFIYSVFMEILQPIVAQRFFSLGDILANGLGCFTAMLLIPRIDKWLVVRVYK